MLSSKRLAVALGVVAVGALTAPAAQADFSGTNLVGCTGSSITGEGSSFQKTAQAAWTADFSNNVTAGGCPTWKITGQTVTYLPNGSGAGLKDFGAGTNGGTPGVYSSTVRFGGTDDPPTVAQQATMEAGANGFHGALQTIPVTQGAISVIVHAPAGCTIPAANAASHGRFEVSNTVLEAAFAGDSTETTWGQLIPGISGSGCVSTPITRVVRFDTSGSTFALKQFLGAINPSRGWNSLANTAWPNDSGSTAVARPTSKGGGALASLLLNTVGGIGYVDLATARSKGFDETAGATDYWIPVAGPSGAFAEPTQDANSISNGVKGANCANASYSGVPASTRSNWSTASGVMSPFGYPVCTLTYDLAWDDASTAYGNTAAEQANQRSVKDYMTYIVSNEGQTIAQQNDYAPLPSDIQSESQAGTTSIGWAK